MGLLDDLAGNVLGGLIPGVASGHPALAPILQLLQNQPGGIAGLAEKFSQGGLGDVAQSWIGQGANQPVSAQQIQGVLGDGMVQDLAQKMGISSQDASGHLAELLPGIVNHLTPNGAAPQQGDLLSMAQGLLSSLGKAQSA